MQITFTGSPRGLALLRHELEAAGHPVSYEPPIEERSAGEVIVSVVMYVVDNSLGGVIGGAATAGAIKAVEAAKAKLPGARIDVRDDDRHG